MTQYSIEWYTISGPILNDHPEFSRRYAVCVEREDFLVSTYWFEDDTLGDTAYMCAGICDYPVASIDECKYVSINWVIENTSNNPQLREMFVHMKTAIERSLWRGLQKEQVQKDVNEGSPGSEIL